METNVNNFEVLIDISSTGTSDYEKLCVLNVDYDQGETLDTWNDLCSAISNSVKTVLDPTWSMSFKFDKTSPVAQFIIGKEYAVGAEATAPIRIVNKLKNKQIEFTATLSGINPGLYGSISSSKIPLVWNSFFCLRSHTFKESSIVDAF